MDGVKKQRWWKLQRLTPTFLSSSLTMFRAEILADMVSAVAENPSPAGKTQTCVRGFADG